MMFEVGDRWGMRQTLCVATKDEVEEKCNYTIVPGQVYEIVYVVDPPIKREDLPKLYRVFKDLENRFAEVGVNYIGVSGIQ
jgi:hypothetical protein